MMRFVKYYFSFYTGIKKDNWLLFASILLSAISSSTIVFIPLYLLNNMQLDGMAVGLMISSIGLGSALGGYAGGYFSDKYTPKLVSITSLLASSILLFSFSLLSNLHLIAGILFLFGGVNTAFLPASRLLLMADTNVPGEMQHLSGIRYMLVNLGFGAGVYFGGLLSAMKYIFPADAFLLLVACFIVFLLRSSQQAASSKKGNNVTVKLNRAIFSQIVFVGIVLFLVSLAFAQIRAPYALYTRDVMQLSTQQFSHLFLLNAFLIILLQVPLSKLLSAYKDKFILAMGSLLIGLGLIILIFSRTYFAALISACLWTLGEILFFSNMQSYMYEHMPEGYKGKSMGIYQLLYSSANVLGPSLGMLIYRIDTGYSLWALCFVGCALAAMIIYSRQFSMISFQKNQSLSTAE